MKKQKLDPEIQQAFSELFKGLTEKDSVENYPCKDIPCEYWWVRYTTACTYLKDAFDKIWHPKIHVCSEETIAYNPYTKEWECMDCGRAF